MLYFLQRYNFLVIYRCKNSLIYLYMGKNELFLTIYHISSGSSGLSYTSFGHNSMVSM